MADFDKIVIRVTSHTETQISKKYDDKYHVLILSYELLRLTVYCDMVDEYFEQSDEFQVYMFHMQIKAG